MRIAVFSTHSHDREFLTAADVDHHHELVFFEPRLSAGTAALADGFPVVCAFVNDELDQRTLEILAAGGTGLVALRSAGFNNVDLAAARDVGLRVVRVPAYSPHAVAEHTIALILALDRKINRASTRVHDGNFSLDGLLGFDLAGRTAGVVGTGAIGATVAQILSGFGMRVLATDPVENPRVTALGAEYVSLGPLLSASDVVSLHLPLTAETHHLIDERTIEQMKPGAMLINTSRGGLIDSRAVIHGLKSGRIGYLGLDVYEEETDLFSYDLSGQIIQDDVFSRLITFPNVVVTAHQGFFTVEALQEIARVTLRNVDAFAAGGPLENEVRPLQPVRDRDHLRAA